MKGKALAVNLKKKRIQLGVTQKELAQKTGISQSLICNYERCKISPTPPNIKRITDALGCAEMDIIIDETAGDSKYVADYLGISEESVSKLRGMCKSEKAFFDGVIRGYMTA